MESSLQIVTLLHILFATLWFAYSLGQSRMMKQFAGLDADQWKVLLADVQRRTRMGLVMGILTLGSGVGLIVLMGGMKNVSPAIHTALSVSLVMVALTFFGQGGIVRKLSEQLDGDSGTRLAGAKRYAMFTGLIHLGWLINLSLMVFRHYWTVS